MKCDLGFGGRQDAVRQGEKGDLHVGIGYSLYMCFTFSLNEYFQALGKHKIISFKKKMKSLTISTQISPQQISNLSSGFPPYIFKPCEGMQTNIDGTLHPVPPIESMCFYYPYVYFKA